MLKKLRNECLIQFEIINEGPLLIKSGWGDVSGLDMTPVLTMNEGEKVPYIPGTSLKGAFRSYAEKITRTVAPNGNGCCNPFQEAQSNSDQAPCSCSSILKIQAKNRTDLNRADLTGPEIYRAACPICKTFGCLFLAGRLNLDDALYNGSKGYSEKRDCVGIDRHTGGVASGPFNMEVVKGGKFETRLTIRNFELWQLGLLAFIIRDMEQGLIRFGMGKSRGFGKVSIGVKEISIRYLGIDPPIQAGTPCNLMGMRYLEPEEKYKPEQYYNFNSNEAEPFPLSGTGEEEVLWETDPFGLFTHCIFSNQVQFTKLWQTVAPVWIAYAASNPHSINKLELQ